MANTILITGATGFTGRWFARAAVAEGYRCVGTSISNSGEDRDFAALYRCDLNNRAQIETVLQQVKPDYIIHLAAISFVAHGLVQDIYQTNVIGTVNLLDAVKAVCPGIAKILVASSGNVYGNSVELPISEHTALAPANDYAVSKVAMEYACKVRHAELPIVITRPFNYTGVGQAEHFLLPKIVAAFKRQQATLELGNLAVARDFTDVRDVVSAYLKLLASDVTQGVFNVCSGKPTSLLEVIELMQQIAGYNIEVKVNPAFVRANEVKSLYGAEHKLVAQLGMYRQYADLMDTLAWMYHSN